MNIKTVATLPDGYELTVYSRQSVELSDGTGSAGIEIGLGIQSAREFLTECLRALDDIEGKA